MVLSQYKNKKHRKVRVVTHTDQVEKVSISSIIFLIKVFGRITVYDKRD